MNGLLDSERVASLQAVLAHWNIPPVRSIEAVHKDHPVFKITTVGAAFTLKDITGAPNLPRLEFTRDVLKHVAQSGLRVPVPVPARSAQSAVQAEGRYYLLSEFIEAGEYPSDPELKAELFYQTGRAMAVLHKALASYADDDVSSKTWREDLAGSVAGWISALCDGLPDHQSPVVRIVGLERGDSLEVALRGLPEQLIHRDCHPGNVLVDGARVIGFIDWEDLCIGPRLFDLAYYAVHHVKWEIDDNSATNIWLSNLPRLLKGYRSHYSLSEEEAAALPYAMIAYHLLLSHWHMGLVRMENIELELRALYWIHTNFDTIVSAVT